MIELPEALTLARQLKNEIIGKTVVSVNPPTKPHKFCWWNGEPSDYEEMLRGKTVLNADGFGIFVEISFSDNMKLCVNDGVNLRFTDAENAPKNYQLLINFSDGTALVLTVAMYGGIILHTGGYDNEYYLKSRNSVSPFSNEFPDYYRLKLNECTVSLSAKAFLATEQRFPGIGNGVSQDILLAAGINPKSKISKLSSADTDNLRECIISVLGEMTASGGRDTEKDIYGNPGGYRTKMSKNNMYACCPVCGGIIKKETYLGGSVYYCTACQIIQK